MSSLNAQRNLRNTTGPLQSAMQRLSSGLRINSAKDDAAGMAIATRMDTQIRGLTVSMRNANDALSFIQTSEGAVNEMINDVERIYELGVQSASNNTVQDRKSMDLEVQELIHELDRIVTQTRYNGEQFLNKTESWNYQIGAQVDETITINTENLSPTAIGVTSTSLNKWKTEDVAKATWSTYKSAINEAFSRDVKINGVFLGGSIEGDKILNNSKAIIDRTNKYTSETNVSAMSYGNALVASQALSLASGSISADAGFIAINGVSVGSLSRTELTEQEKTAIQEQAKTSASAKWDSMTKPEKDQRTAEIKAEFLKKISDGELKPLDEVQKEMTSDDLATKLTSDYIASGKINEANVEESLSKALAKKTAANIASVINDKSAETGVNAFVVSNSRLIFSNITGGGISYMMDISKIKSDKGDSFKDVNFGFKTEGGAIEGGQNGVIILNDNRFEHGSIDFDSAKTSALFGYGVVTLNNKVENIQGKAEITDKLALKKKSVGDLNISTEVDAKIAMMVTSKVLDKLNAFKAVMGAKMNRIESTVRNIDNVRENLSAAKSRIIDADFAVETANLTKSMILQQAGISVLAQANSQPQSVLALLQQR
jgi:flagellin